jgi:hypothetical protein
MILTDRLLDEVHINRVLLKDVLISGVEMRLNISGETAGLSWPPKGAMQNPIAAKLSGQWLPRLLRLADGSLQFAPIAILKLYKTLRGYEPSF